MSHINFVAVLLSALILIQGCSNHSNPVLRDPDVVVLLYPEGQDSASSSVPGSLGPAHSNGLIGPERHLDEGFIENVGDSARMEIWFPDEPNGLALLICPGGGYSSLNALRTGTAAGSWLSFHGFTAVVLDYRMPCGDIRLPIRDATNAMLYCRKMALQWGVAQIGIVGGSAGGHLAALISSQPETPEALPDFTVLLYPLTTLMLPNTDDEILIRMFGHIPTVEERKSISAEYLVHENMPPVFIAANRHDLILPQDHFIGYYEALVKAGVDAEMHLYSEGIHGWGFMNGEMCKEYCNGSGAFEDQMSSSRAAFEGDLLNFLSRQINDKHQ